ncbi:MAG: single-stranded-DNA-specific exonuclease RecJ, partial [Phormidesmis sp.]
SKGSSITPPDLATEPTLPQPHQSSKPPPNPLPDPPPSQLLAPAESILEAVGSQHVEFYHSKRRYKATLEKEGGDRQLSIQNPENHLLVVQMSERQGFLYLPEQAPQVVDIADTKYFNLIRAGLSALEVKQKTQLLIKKDELLAEKDGQITTMKAQIALLEEKITQLSAEQQQQFADLKREWQVQESTIQGQEAHVEELMEQLQVPVSPPLPNVADLKQQIRTAIGDSVWFCLQPTSQKDLQAAYKNYQLIHTDGPDAPIADYSEAGIRLSLAVEREVLTPFFKDLAEFALDQGKMEVGAIALKPTAQYRLEMMPPLLADQWRSFGADALSGRSRPEGGIQLVKVNAPPAVSSSDRALIAQFFAQWAHPMAACFSAKSRQAAASLDQISQLRNIAAHRERFLYRWHYELLHQLIAGKAGKGGLLRQIFS